jgi:hypothetical protein
MDEWKSCRSALEDFAKLLRTAGSRREKAFSQPVARCFTIGSTLEMTDQILFPRSKIILQLGIEIM